MTIPTGSDSIPRAEDSASALSKTSEGGRINERLSDRLLSLIVEGRYKPGDRLPTEQEISKTYGCSRIMVREALSTLAGMGVIEQAQGHRRRVKKLDTSVFERLFPLLVALEQEKTLHDIFTVRRALESCTVRLAATHRTKAQLDGLAANVESYHICLESNEHEIVRQKKLVLLDRDFHLMIAKASGNTILPILMDCLAAYVKEVQLRGCEGDLSKNCKAYEAHVRIVEQLRRRDPEASAIAMAYHLQVAEEGLNPTVPPEA